MSVLVVCVDVNDGGNRDGSGEAQYIVGQEEIESLVYIVGLEDPENSQVNCLLEALKVTKELENAGEKVEVAIVSGRAGAMVSDSSKSLARQLDLLIEEIKPDSAILVIGSIEEERLIPILESRIRIDAVDRVIVRQIHDLESRYYLAKRFLADDELRSTILVPMGVVLTILPILSYLVDIRTTFVVITTVLGVFVVYKALDIEDNIAILPTKVRETLYSGRVSVVTYVVAVGLILVGIFIGVVNMPTSGDGGKSLTSLMGFVHYGIPWVALGGVVMSLGKALDRIIRSRQVKTAHINLIFGIISTAVVIRGFSSYFLQQQNVIGAFGLGKIRIAGLVEIGPLIWTAEEHLAILVGLGILVSVVGIKVAPRIRKMQNKAK
jgi:putative membrane protein